MANGCRGIGTIYDHFPREGLIYCAGRTRKLGITFHLHDFFATGLGHFKSTMGAAVTQDVIPIIGQSQLSAMGTGIPSIFRFARMFMPHPMCHSGFSRRGGGGRVFVLGNERSEVILGFHGIAVFMQEFPNMGKHSLPPELGRRAVVDNLSVIQYDNSFAIGSCSDFCNRNSVREQTRYERR